MPERPPDTIYLQWNQEQEEDATWPEEGVTWCVDKIENDDIEYTRADIAVDLLAACKTEVPELANLAAMVDPELAMRLMEGVYAAIAKAKGTPL